MNDSTLRTIKSEDGLKTFRLKPTWESKSFKITLLENMNAWFGDVTEDTIIDLANERQKDKDDYFNEVKECINDVKSNNSFDIINTDSGCKFVIYRKVGRNKIKFFVIELEKVDYQLCIDNLLDEINTRNISLLNLLQDSEQEKNAAYNEKQLYEQKLQEFVESKANWEMEMYSSFLLLLNEKKKRISFLTNLLQSRKDIDSQVNLNNAKVKSKSKKQSVESVAVREAVSESDQDTEEYDTDNEDDMETNQDDIEVQPSSSKYNVDLLRPDSPPVLLLPKRVKSNVQKEVVNPVVKLATDELKRKSPEPSSTEEPTPVLEFSTQDLIDRM